MEKLVGERLNGLDELRGVAIGMVLLTHLATQLGGGSLTADLILVPATGVGVDLFFVISGVVVVQSLNGLQQRLGAWDAVSAFYVRRFARIVPAAWFVALVGALGIFVPGTIIWADVRAALSFTSNVHWSSCFAAEAGCGRLDGMGHFWSVASEMQFYLIAPALLLAPRRSLWIGLSIVAGVGAFMERPWGGQLWTFRAEALLLGLVLGVEIVSGRVRLLSRVPAMTIPEAVIWMIGAGLIVRLFQPFASGAAIVVVAAFAGYVVLGSILRPDLWGQGMAARGLAWLGGRCYAVYLVHPFVIGLVGFMMRPTFGFEVTAVTAAALSTVVGWYVERAVEIPARQLGYWLTRA